jgi:hypothetical protein
MPGKSRPRSATDAGKPGENYVALSVLPKRRRNARKSDILQSSEGFSDHQICTAVEYPILSISSPSRSQL